MIKIQQWFKQFLVKAIVPTLLLVSWLLVSTYGDISPILLPKLENVFKDFIFYTKNGELLFHIKISLFRCFIGFSMGSLLGIGSGIMIQWFSWLGNLFSGTINFIRSIPKTALAPLFIVWFGFGDLPKILLIGLASFFYTIIPTIEGVENVDNQLIKSAHSMGARDYQILFTVILPAALPSIYAGIRIAATSSFVVLVFVEIIAGNSGLGYLLEDSRESLNTSTMLMTLIVIGILGFCLDGFVRYSEKVLMPWRKGKTISK